MIKKKLAVLEDYRFLFCYIEKKQENFIKNNNSRDIKFRFYSEYNCDIIMPTERD